MASTHPHPPEPARRRPRRASRLAVASVAVLTCGLVSGGVAFAHSGGETSGSVSSSESWRSPWRSTGVRGTVSSVTGTTFVVDAKHGDDVTVTTSEVTAFSLTTPGTVADAAVGSYVVAYGRTGDDGVLTVKWLTVKPAPETAAFGSSWQRRHAVAGVIAANDPATGVLTITTDEGDVAVNTTATTKVKKVTVATIADLTVGASVGVLGTFADDGTLAASRVKVLPAAVGDPTPVPVEPVVSTTIVEPLESTTTTAAPPTTEAPPSTTPPPSDETGVRGTVASVLGATLTVTSRDGATVTVLTDDSTSLRRQGLRSWRLRRHTRLAGGHRRRVRRQGARHRQRRRHHHRDARVARRRRR